MDPSAVGFDSFSCALGQSNTGDRSPAYEGGGRAGYGGDLGRGGQRRERQRRQGPQVEPATTGTVDFAIGEPADSVSVYIEAGTNSSSRVCVRPKVVNVAFSSSKQVSR